MNIQAVSQVAPTSSITASDSLSSKLDAGNGPSSFADVMAGVVQKANGDLNSADAAIADFESGKTSDLNSVVMATAKSDLSFRFLLEMRNRLTESYQELSRMQF